MSATTDRQVVSLARPPDAPAGLVGFPLVSLRQGYSLVRVTRRARGPWWFTSGGRGRFDLSPPEGTCYLAKDEISALLEVLGGAPSQVICSEFLEVRTLHRLSMPVDVELADLTSRGARRFGVTGEIHTLVPYEIPQQWARSLRAVGREGLRYSVRHDPAFGEGIALFGPAGERDGWPRGEVQPCDDPDIRRRLFEICGVRVVPRPTLDQLRVED